MLENKDFYPTPKEIIEKMLEPYSHTKNSMDEEYSQYQYGIKSQYKNILEPSAGKGDIVDYIKEVSRHNTKNIYVLEKDLNLQEIVKIKGIFLGDDFLEYNDDLKFDLIVMNPPFSNGVDHLLKAWEIAKNNTEIVCLLNAETINNPFSEKRKLLQKIIEDNKGEVEFLGKCFDNAERKTDVEVVMIRLKKITKGDFEFNIDFDKEQAENIEEDFLEKGIMSFNKMESIVAEFKEAKKLFRETLKNLHKLESVAKMVAPYIKVSDIIADDFYEPQEKYNKFISELKGGFWRDLINKSKIEKYMTGKLKSQFSEFISDQSSIEISEKNIQKLLEFMLLNKNTILENSIEEVFDDLTKYDNM